MVVTCGLVTDIIANILSTFTYGTIFTVIITTANSTSLGRNWSRPSGNTDCDPVDTGCTYLPKVSSAIDKLQSQVSVRASVATFLQSQ